MNAVDEFQFEQPRPVQRWSFFNTPLRTFLAVMLPILVLMVLLAALPGVPTGIRWTAGAVILISLYALWRGYLHRLEADAEGIAYQTPFTRLAIPWSQVRRIDRYIPPDRNRLTPYVYITRLDHPPEGRHMIDPDTIQLQDRPGLLEALQDRWSRFTSN